MPIHLLFGDNVLELEEAARTIRARFHDVDTLAFDGPTVALPHFAEACLTAGLFDPERLVIVRNLHERFKGARKAGGNDWQEIRQIFLSLAPTTTLLLLCPDMPGDHVLIDPVREAEGKVQPYNLPRRGDLPRWIVARGKHLGVTVERDAAELLAELVGSNAVMLNSELEKISVYAGDDPTVTPAMVETLVGAVTQDSIFSLIDAVAAGDKAIALRLLHTQLESASSSAIDFALYLIRMLARQVRILLRIRLGQEAGRSTGQITTDLKLPRYYADRYFKQARRLPRERLQGAFEQLATFEFGLKSGRAEARIGLDLLIANLCS